MSIVFARLPLRARRKILFRRAHGYSLPKVPRTFSEKIQWRIVNDRREIIAIGGDKLKMKAFASEAAPGLFVPKTYWSGTDLSEITNRDWPTDWVIKPIAGSGFAAFGSKSLEESDVTLTEIDSWDYRSIHTFSGEWAYSQGQPGFLIEERIPTEDGKSPHDLRFFVFDGQVQLIQIDSPRANLVERRFYTPDWLPLSARQGGKRLAPPIEAPALLKQLMRTAEQIASGFDFIRADLYLADDAIYFGELTPYPTGGLGAYSDRGFDEWLGDFWTLPASSRVA